MHTATNSFLVAFEGMCRIQMLDTHILKTNKVFQSAHPPTSHPLSSPIHPQPPDPTNPIHHTTPQGGGGPPDHDPGGGVAGQPRIIYHPYWALTTGSPKLQEIVIYPDGSCGASPPFLWPPPTQALAADKRNLVSALHNLVRI
jgi:hypothetical protein